MSPSLHLWTGTVGTVTRRTQAVAVGDVALRARRIRQALRTVRGPAPPASPRAFQHRLRLRLPTRRRLPGGARPLHAEAQEQRGHHQHVSTTAASRPPSTTTAMGLWISFSGSPPASASGITTRPAESAVISTGFSRSMLAR